MLKKLFKFLLPKEGEIQKKRNKADIEPRSVVASDIQNQTIDGAEIEPQSFTEVLQILSQYWQEDPDKLFTFEQEEIDGSSFEELLKNDKLETDQSEVDAEKDLSEEKDDFSESCLDQDLEDFDLDLEDLDQDHPYIISGSQDMEFESDLDYVECYIEPEYEETRGPSEWLIGMSGEFLKSIKKVDKKLKGRILDAISNLSKEPDKPQGKTIKPLSANLKGFWSCKIGQSHRLIYKPNCDSRIVTLLAYMPRESDYKPHQIGLG